MEQGVWTLILVLGVAGFFLCFAEENGLESESFRSPESGNFTNYCVMLVNGSRWLNPTLFSNSVTSFLTPTQNGSLISL